MTQEEKQLFIKVLCSGLPYETKVEVCIKDKDIKSIDCVKYDTVGTYIRLIDEEKFSVKPYLRPLSSMTKEEKQESRCYRHDIISDDFLYYMSWYAEWLDSKHFDWRTDGNGKTMIEIGLALEATEGMYNN